MKKTFLQIFISLLVIFCGFFSFGQDIPERVDIEAEKLSYDNDSETYQASGDVTISFQGGFIKADNVRLDRSKEEAIAEGHVSIKSGDDILEGEKAQFSIVNDTGTVSGGKLFIDKNHLYLQGKTIEKRDDATYFLEDGRATTCDGDTPDWMFAGREVEVTIDGYGTVKDGTFRIKGVPILYMPYMIFPAKTTRQTGLLFPSIAYSRDKLGWDVNLPFYWAVSDNVDATFYQRYMEKRGFQEGAELRYIVDRDSHGTLYADYLGDSMELSESDGEANLHREWAEDHKRWSYYLDSETTFSPGFYLKTDIKRVSDRWYFRDFDSYNYYMDRYKGESSSTFGKVSFMGDKSLPSLASTVRLVKEWSLFNATALMEYTDNFRDYNNDETLQTYPEVTFTGIRQPLYGMPIDFELISSYGHYYRTEGYRGDVFDVYPVFSLPLGLGDYLNFIPSLGLRETRWSSSYSGPVGGNDDKDGSRELYTVGADMSSEVQRVFNIGGDVVDKIRHGIRPEVTYSYIPNVYQDDRPDFMDEIAEENRVTYSLVNTLIARLKGDDEGVAYREFLRLKLGQVYDINESRRDTIGSLQEKRPFGNLTSELNLNPFKYLSLDSDAEFNVNSGEWVEINSTLDVSDPRGDSFTAEYRYTQDSLEEFNFYFRGKATNFLDLIYVLRKNEFDNKTLETTYAIDYHQQCWGVELSYTDSPDDASVMVVFSLYGFGRTSGSKGKNYEQAQ